MWEALKNADHGSNLQCLKLKTKERTILGDSKIDELWTETKQLRLFHLVR